MAAVRRHRIAKRFATSCPTPVPDNGALRIAASIVSLYPDSLNFQSERLGKVVTGNPRCPVIDRYSAYWTVQLSRDARLWRPRPLRRYVLIIRSLRRDAILLRTTGPITIRSGNQR